jgi:hypothetical protein
MMISMGIDSKAKNPIMKSGSGGFRGEGCGEAGYGVRMGSQTKLQKVTSAINE